MKFISQKKGFTLVEMIVSIAIFTVVALVAVGALLKVVDANKKSQSLKTSINNVNFALESMLRELRVGSTYKCTKGDNPFISFSSFSSDSSKNCNVASGGDDWVIAFYSSKTAVKSGGGLCNLIHEYRYRSDSTVGMLEKAEQQSCEDNTSPEFVPIISPDVIFETATMDAKTGLTGETVQSYVFFRFKGYSGVKERNKTYFDIQTSVSQRIFE